MDRTEKAAPLHSSFEARLAWLKLNGHIAVSSVAAVPLALQTYAPTILIPLGIMLTVTGLVWALKSAPDIEVIRNSEARALTRAEERTAAIIETLGRVLHGIAVELELDLSRSRISVYTHVDEQFFLVKRYSTNPTLAKSGRPQYPDNQGLIGKVWATGKTQLVTHLPKDRRLWNQACTEVWGIPPAVAAALRMQARSLLGRRIDSGPEHARTGTGLIILESLDAKGLVGEQRDKLEQFSALLMEVLALSVEPLDDRDAVTPVTRVLPRRASPEA